jgi:cell division septum initiation protein DivIVA
VNDLDREAGQRIAGDITKIESLTRVLNKETSSLDDKKKALDTLKELYPEYYGELDEATFSSDTLAQSTEALKKELMDLARIDVYRRKLDEINESLIDLELREGKPETMTKAVLLPLGTGFEVLNAIIRKTTSGNQDLKKSLQTKIDINQFKNLNIEKEHLLELLDELEDKYPEEKKEIERVSHAVKELEKGTGDLTEETKELSGETKGLLDGLTKIPKLAPAIAKAWEEMFPEKKENKMHRFFERIKEDMVFLFGDLGELGDHFERMLDGALQIFDAFQKKMTIKAENENKRRTELIDDNYDRQKEAIENSLMSEEQKSLKLEALDTKTQEARTKLEEETEKKLAVIKRREAIKNKAMAIMNTIINTASAVAEALPIIPLAILSAAMGAVQLGIIASTPLPLAEGGLVTSPTTALIGEAGPEVVIPLDRVQSMMGGQNQNITVTGKLIGNDIFLSNAKTGVNRLRTV